MTRFNPFPDVGSRYGAQMGRVSAHPGNLIDTPQCLLKARQARFEDGGYDEGGVYWGAPADVWAVWSVEDPEGTVQYVRANSYRGAIDRVFEEFC